MVLLVCLLGWSGFYRFYKKQYSIGVLYFFTAGLFCVGWGIDIYRAIKDSLEKPKKIKESDKGETKKTAFPDEEKSAFENGAKYYLESFGSRIAVIYEDRIVFMAKRGKNPLITGVLCDSEKTVYYADCTGLKYKNCDIMPGFFKLETASSESVFEWDKKYQTNEKMTEVKLFISDKISQYKRNS